MLWVHSILHGNWYIDLSSLSIPLKSLLIRTFTKKEYGKIFYQKLGTKWWILDTEGCFSSIQIQTVKSSLEANTHATYIKHCRMCETMCIFSFEHYLRFHLHIEYTDEFHLKLAIFWQFSIFSTSLSAHSIEQSKAKKKNNNEPLTSSVHLL